MAAFLADSSKSLHQVAIHVLFKKMYQKPLSISEYSDLPTFTVNNATVYVTVPLHYKFAMIHL